MDSYSRAGRAFDEAYRRQLEAQDMQRRSSQEDEAVFGDYVRQSQNFESGSPFAQEPGSEGDFESFDAPMDERVDRVESVKESLLASARKRANAVAPTDF